MSDSSPRRYSSEEVNAILQRALERQGGGAAITHDELIETARELGIDPAQLDAAIDDHAANAGLDAAREQWKKNRRQKFYEHLFSFFVVNGFLFVIDLLTGGPDWFWFPFLGWGIAVAFDAYETFFPSDEKIEHGARRLVEKRSREEWKSLRRSIKKDLKIDGKQGKIVIEKGDKRIEIG